MESIHPSKHQLKPFKPVSNLFQTCFKRPFGGLVNHVIWETIRNLSGTNYAHIWRRICGSRHARNWFHTGLIFISQIKWLTRPPNGCLKPVWNPRKRHLESIHPSKHRLGPSGTYIFLIGGNFICYLFFAFLKIKFKHITKDQFQMTSKSVLILINLDLIC